VKRQQLVILGIILVAVVAALLVWHGGKAKPKQAEEKSDPNTVEVAVEAQKNAGVTISEAGDRNLQQAISTTGVIAPDEARVAHIVPLAKGIVEDVMVQLGARVAKGQPLLMYDNIELGESIGEYQNLMAGLQKAQAQEQVAERSVERANALIKVEAISLREFELRKAEYEQAQAEVKSARAEAARAEEKLHRFGLTDDDIGKLHQSGSSHSIHRTASHNTLRAPFSGVITKYEASRGEVVDLDKELFTVVDTSTVWALADVYEKDIQYVSRGGECRVNVASYPDQVFKGTITYLGDTLDPASRTAKLRCVLANGDGRLKLEMFATVSIPRKESRTGLTVPASAIQEVNGTPVVFVQKDASHFEKRTVTLGDKNEQFAEVRSGVRPGEKVVANGSFYMKSTLLRDLIGGEE
jgi:cobalt-zinc-cadmium efflux system membrane fusion protein